MSRGWGFSLPGHLWISLHSSVSSCVYIKAAQATPIAVKMRESHAS